jgi:hypothetical protein
MSDEYDPRIDEAKQFLKLASEADSNNRAEALEDLKFAAGDQWPVEIQNSRSLEARPCLTINKLDAYCRQVTNQQRQARPRIKVHGMNSQADAKVAEILTGICRHIEVNSDADTAYDEAFDYAVRMGWGYFRIVTDYVRADSFDQEIYIRAIRNPFTVYFDPNSTLPDGSDAEKAMITEVISKDAFRAMYPNADDGSSFLQRGTGDGNAQWVMKEDIRIAEYFYVERKRSELLMLSDGTTVYEDELTKEAQSLMDEAGITIIDSRETVRKRIKWMKCTAMEVLEEQTFPGRYIPIIPVYANQVTIESKRKKFGLVRMAKDAQKMYNFWQTSLTETVALAPKAKWLLAEGQDEGHENEWAQANIKAFPVLRYKQTDIDGRQAPVPTRVSPETVPTGIMAASAQINQDLQAVLGIVDPNQMPQGNISGKALLGQQQQVDLTNFHYYDNLTRSIRHAGKIILDVAPVIYNSQRVMRIIGDDGRPDMVTINERDAVGKIMNDITVGDYDVVMDTGPGYNSKRLEAVNAMLPLMQGNQELFNVAGDLVFRNMDFPGAETIADRLATINPLANVDDKSDIPPQVQMKMAQAQQQMQQMQQQMEAMQTYIQQRGDIEQVKQDNETKRELLRQTAKAHNTETIAEVKVHDQNTRAVTSQNKVEIEAIMELLLHHMDTARLNAEITKRNKEQAEFMNVANTDIEQGRNPLVQ